MRTRFLVAVAAWALVILVARGRAWGAAAPSGRESPENRQYTSLLEEAVSEYDARRYEEARALFRKAHEIAPNARTLRGIGMASFELREYVEALRALEGALSNKRRPLTSTQRQQVQGLAERSRAFVGRFFVKLVPKDAVLHIDAAPAVFEDDGSVLLSFGRHLLSAEASGRGAESREVNVIGGERQDLTLELRLVASGAVNGMRQASGGGVGETLIAPRRDEIPAEPRRWSRAPWWFAGAGVLVAGTVGGYFWWRYQNDQITTCEGAGVCRNRGVLIDRERFALGVMIGGAAGALALGTIGTVVWVKNGKIESATALACSPGYGAVNCEFKLTF
jgi:hypothetical protein